MGDPAVYIDPLFEAADADGDGRLDFDGESRPWSCMRVTPDRLDHPEWQAFAVKFFPKDDD